MFTAGVVEMLAGGKDLHRLSAGAGSQVEQPWVQALFEKQVRRQDSQHGQGLPQSDPQSRSNPLPIVSFSQRFLITNVVQEGIRRGAMKPRCKPADLGNSQACIPITHNWETMKLYNQLSPRLRRMIRDGPGKVRENPDPVRNGGIAVTFSLCARVNRVLQRLHENKFSTKHGRQVFNFIHF
jgi:hypothetical protein